MKAEYFNSVEQVLLSFNPIGRFLSKFLPRDWFVMKCKDCKKIPTEIYGGKCLDCSTQNR